METPLDRRRIWIFLAFAFGIAWLVALVIFLTGGLVNSPALISGTPYTLAVVLLAVGYMWAPALANIFTRLITREGRRELWLKPKIKRGWLYWLVAWFGTGLITLGCGALFYLLFPQYFDSSMGMLREMLAATGVVVEMAESTLWLLFFGQAISAILVSAIANSLFTFGEEFGWRGYLLQKLLPLGWRKAVLILGIIWGVWHWPVIAMGHNYGLEYTGYPWVGMIGMVWFCILLSMFFSWTTLKAGSVWPAVIGHAVINGIAALPVFFLQGEPHPALGPLAIGVAGSIVWALIAILLFLRPGKFELNEQTGQPRIEAAAETTNLG